MTNNYLYDRFKDGDKETFWDVKTQSWLTLKKLSGQRSLTKEEMETLNNFTWSELMNKNESK